MNQPALRSALWLGLVQACAQTDLVAKVEPDCPTGSDCAEHGSCQPRACAALGSREALCQSDALPVLAGDGCSAAQNGTPVSRFAVCSCSDLVATGSVTIDAFSGSAITPAPGRGALG